MRDNRLLRATQLRADTIPLLSACHVAAFTRALAISSAALPNVS